MYSAHIEHLKNIPSFQWFEKFVTNNTFNTKSENFHAIAQTLFSFSTIEDQPNKNCNFCEEMSQQLNPNKH